MVDAEGIDDEGEKEGEDLGENVGHGLEEDYFCDAVAVLKHLESSAVNLDVSFSASIVTVVIIVNVCIETNDIDIVIVIVIVVVVIHDRLWSYCCCRIPRTSSAPLAPCIPIMTTTTSIFISIVNMTST